jgi:hypothetical protein
MKDGTDFPPNYLLVYRFADRAPGDVEDPGNLLMIVPVNGRRKYLIEDPEPVPGDIFTYAATLTNKAYLESPVGRPRSLRIGKFLLRKTR